MIQREHIKGIVLASFIIVLAIFISIPLIYSAPVGITVTSDSSSQIADVSTSRSDDGGTITTIVVDAQQKNDGWKGYVGNVTGKFTLGDSDGYSIYDWSFTVTSGEVYISRASSPNWSSAGCALPPIIDAEESFFSQINNSDYDEISDTFNETIHKNFRVGLINITNSTCPSTFIYVNSSRNDTISEDTPFQQVLLQMNGTTNALVYTSIMETDHMGYHEDYTYDFQAIVPDNRSFGGITTYYFWAELGY